MILLEISYGPRPSDVLAFPDIRHALEVSAIATGTFASIAAVPTNAPPAPQLRALQISLMRLSYVYFKY